VLKILVTGAAGFIGMHVSAKLADYNCQLICIDNLNNYYDIHLKKSRLSYLKNKIKNFNFEILDIQDLSKLKELFLKNKFDLVLHLAAQAGVRYSLKNPHAYIDANIYGFLNILEMCKDFKVKHMVFASSSSVYGLNEKIPFSETHETNHPVSLYAATKKSNEMMAHSYSHLYNLPITGLRFFTVYGPWGRPDMAPYIFAKAIKNEEEIELFNHGDMIRDFTYIDDVVQSIINVLFKTAEKDVEFDPRKPKPNVSSAPYRIFNVGNSIPITVLDFVKTMEFYMGKKCKKKFIDMQLGDVKITSSNNELLMNWTGFKPKTSLDTGLKEFCNWFNKFYN